MSAAVDEAAAALAYATLNDPTQPPPPFAPERHAAYLKRVAADAGALEYALTEYMRVSGVYWGLTAMRLLGRDAAAELGGPALVELARGCQNADGGFGGARRGPHVIPRRVPRPEPRAVDLAVQSVGVVVVRVVRVGGARVVLGVQLAHNLTHHRLQTVRGRRQRARRRRRRRRFRRFCESLLRFFRPPRSDRLPFVRRRRRRRRYRRRSFPRCRLRRLRRALARLVRLALVRLLLRQKLVVVRLVRASLFSSALLLLSARRRRLQTATECPGAARGDPEDRGARRPRA